jgi:hypothetical protein
LYWFFPNLCEEELRHDRYRLRVGDVVAGFVARNKDFDGFIVFMLDTFVWSIRVNNLPKHESSGHEKKAL